MIAFLTFIGLLLGGILLARYGLILLGIGITMILAAIGISKRT